MNKDVYIKRWRIFGASDADNATNRQQAKRKDIEAE